MRLVLALSSVLMLTASQDEPPLYRLQDDRLYRVEPAGPDVLVAEEFSHPIRTKGATPQFPAAAIAAAQVGGVWFDATIKANGALADVELVREITTPELRRAALEAVTQWVYEPVRLNGSPIRLRIRLTVHFTEDADRHQERLLDSLRRDLAAPTEDDGQRPLR